MYSEIVGMINGLNKEKRWELKCLLICEVRVRGDGVFFFLKF